MIISVDADLALPVYEQIREQVVRMVVAGTLAPGTRMPTIRQLANDLQLAKGTVAKAYALLEGGEVLESRGHRGTFIAAGALAPPTDNSTAARALENAADAFVVAARQLGLDAEAAADAVRQRWNHV